MDLCEIEGGITEKEGQHLRELASTCEYPIVEIGSYLGKSTCYLASGSQNMKVYAIDLWNMRSLPEDIKEEKINNTGSKHDVAIIAKYTFPPDGSGNIADRITNKTWKKFLSNIKEMGFEDTIIPIKSASQEIAKVWTQKIGLLFIDGNHQYESCLADYNEFAKNIVSGGYLALHDYTNKYGYEVKKVVDEVIKPSGLWTDWFIVDGLISAKRK